MINDSNPFSLRGKTILVTGASSGIGRATAVESSKLGARVILVARREEELQRTRENMHGDGHEVVPFDLLCGEKLVTWMSELVKDAGPLNGLVHAAGISVTMPFKATSESLYRSIMAINTDTSYWLLKAFRQKVVHAPKASAVLLGSVSGTVGTAGLTAYCASKGALLGLAQSAALEFIRDSVRVNVVSPALVQTALAESYASSVSEEGKSENLASHPMGIGRPEDVAYAAIYLLSDASAWVTGTNLVVDGGYTAR